MPEAVPARNRKAEPAARREAILDAALTVFAESGFEAARLDDVAAKAGVAKGTLYLYFKDKEALFEEVVRGAASPIVERLGALAAAPELSMARMLEAMFELFEKEVLGTKRKLIIRLILAEGPRFPRIAEFYYRDVVGRILPMVAKIAQRAAERGELPNDAIARYPQLVAAPLLLAVIWDALFARIKPLDVADFLRAHRDVLTARKEHAAMKRQLAALVLVLLAVGGGVASYYYLVPHDAPRQYQGWVEADFVFVSPDEIARIETLAVREGSTVQVGSPLFTLDDDLQRAAVADNEAAVTNAKQAYDRAQVLLKRAVGSQKAFDDADAALRSAQAKLNSARTRLERRARASPVAGTIQEVYFRGGEMVEPGRPIVSILPPQNVKVRFFVPQSILPSVAIGDRVRINCDGCRDDLYARVSFISAQAEFSPPVIYSLEERARLVFRIEALPERPEDMRIGQPASVALLNAPPRETAHVEK